MNITERINVQHIKETIETYGIDTVEERGICCICNNIGNGIKKGLTFCSPEHIELIFPE